MLFATGKSTRRLFRAGDSYDRAREGGKIVPETKDLPPEYRHLIDWYYAEYAPKSSERRPENSILALRGIGKEIWADEDPDAYVRRLREG